MEILFNRKQQFIVKNVTEITEDIKRKTSI